MSVLVPVIINGQTTIQGQPLLAHAEYTSGPIVERYQDNMEVFNEIFNLNSATATADINNPANNFAARIQASIADLNTIAANGVVDPADVGSFPSPVAPRRLTVQMVTAMDNLYRTLNIAGIPTDGSPVTASQILDWRNISYSSKEVQSTLTLADAASGAQNKTLQALVELVYVETGNQILSSSLGSLQNALSTTSTVLTTLNDIQQLHNQITAVDKESFGAYVSKITGVPNRLDTRIQANSYIATAIAAPIPGRYAFRGLDKYDGNGVLIPINDQNHYSFFPSTFGQGLYVYVDNYWGSKGTANWVNRIGQGQTLYAFTQKIASDRQGDPSLFGYQIPSLASLHFGVLSPEVSSALAASMNPYILNFLSIRQKLQVQIQALSSITIDKTDTQTLYARLKVVYSGMERAINVNNGYMPSALKMWILDNQSAGVKLSTGSPNAAAVNALIDAKNRIGGPGDIQTQINNAITAGQNLNDTQKETTRQYLFVFEEYYKSASAILTKLTQIIEKMAQGIAR